MKSLNLLIYLLWSFWISTVIEENVYLKKNSVMQSDGNSFCGDVVLDSFNMVYSGEDSI